MSIRLTLYCDSVERRELHVSSSYGTESEILSTNNISLFQISLSPREIMPPPALPLHVSPPAAPRFTTPPRAIVKFEDHRFTYVYNGFQTWAEGQHRDTCIGLHFELLRDVRDIDFLRGGFSVPGCDQDRPWPGVDLQALKQHPLDQSFQQGPENPRAIVEENSVARRSHVLASTRRGCR